MIFLFILLIKKKLYLGYILGFQKIIKNFLYFNLKKY